MTALLTYPTFQKTALRAWRSCANESVQPPEWMILGHFITTERTLTPEDAPTPVLGSGNFIFFLWLCHFWMVYIDGLQQYVLFLAGFFVVACCSRPQPALRPFICLNSTPGHRESTFDLSVLQMTSSLSWFFSFGFNE